jgi:putative ABC transport system permease protein
MAAYLAIKELWRGRSRFFLFSMVIALITVLVLFVAALTEGLGSGNREYIEKLDAQLLAYQKRADLLINASQLDPDLLREIRRNPGVAEAGPIAVANVTVELGSRSAKVALLGVEPGKPGEPIVTVGRQLTSRDGREVIMDRNAAIKLAAKVGDTVVVHSTQGNKEERYPVRIVGIANKQQLSLQPTVILPYRAWDEVRPGAVPNRTANDLVANVIAIRVNGGVDPKTLAGDLNSAMSDLQVVDLKTAYESTPGYTAQQSTLDTQRYFALLIGVLVIGGFFQILTLQKVPQIGMLKAIGASNQTVGVTSVLEIIVVTIVGVGIGAVGTLALSLGFPPTIPIVFAPGAVLASVASLLLIGPLGGLVSVFYAVRVEPLTALGLGS